MKEVGAGNSPYYCMHNVFDITDTELINVFGETTIYVNDDITTFSGTYTDLADLRTKLGQAFGDDVWSIQTIPISNDLDSGTRTIVISLFPNIKYVTESINYTFNGVYYQSRPTGVYGGASTLYGAGSNKIGVLSQHTERNTISFCVWTSEGITIDRTKTVENIRVRFYDLFISNGTFSLANQWGQVSYGNEISYNIRLRYADSDPYTPGGTSEPGGGEGNHDDTSDPVPVSDLPTLSISDTKFITLYNPTLQQINDLAVWMWSPLCVIEDLKKLWNNPMQAILGLSIVPVSPVIYDTPSQIYLGNLASPVTANKIATQYKRVPCGYIDVEEYWGSYLDYSPYTKAEIYLPYIGTKELNVDDIMGKQVSLIYNIDIASGACVAQLLCGDSVLYQFSGNCATSVPITGNDWTNVINGAISVAVSGAMLAVGVTSGTAPVMASTAVGVAGSIAQNVMSMKPSVLKSGSLSGSSGFLGVQKPYLMITRPRQAVPERQNKYTGYPSYITAQLSELNGMTYVADCHLENINCTDGEMKEIERLLKEGVIL